MTPDADVQARINRLFVEKLHLEVPRLDTDLLATGILDSLHFTDLLLHLEQEFGITISLAVLELDHFRTLENISGFVAAFPLTSFTQTVSPDGQRRSIQSQPQHG
jgi:methoxymalonate biosynthesis acyl carrier protein